MPETHQSTFRWTSRKFILAVSAQITALLVLFWPGHESVIVEASTSVASLIVVLASSLGYVSAEAMVDVNRSRAKADAEDDA